MKRPSNYYDMQDYAQKLESEGFFLAAKYWRDEAHFWYMHGFR